MKRKQVLALLLAVAMTANMSMPAMAASVTPVYGSIYTHSEAVETITEEDLAAALSAAVKGNGDSAQSQNAEKEETVYVFTDASGKQKSMTVSNWLKNKDGADKLYDNSALQNIENVKGDETFTQNGEMVTWNAGGNDIYYQGTTDKQPPVQQKITYYYEGQEIAPEDLAGKTGKVTIHIDYENTEKYDDVYVPFTTMTGIIFSNDNVKNVSVDNGSVISEGKNTVVVGMAFPGLSDSLQGAKDDAEHLLDETEASQKSKDKLNDLEIPDSVEITLDATDFKMSTCMTMVFSGLFDDDEEIEEDHDSILKDMDEKIADLEKDGGDLADGAGQLSDGIGEAADGSNQLSDGAGQLSDGVKEYTDGVAKVNEGAGKLADGTGTLVKSMPTLTKGLKTYTDGVSEVDKGLGTLVDSLPDLTGGASALSSGLTQFGAGVSELEGGLGTLQQGTQQLTGNSKALNDGVAQLAGGASKLQSGIKNYTDGVNQLQAGTDQLLAENGLAALSEGAKTLRDGLTAYAGGVENAAGQISKGAQQMVDSAPGAKEKIEKIDEEGLSISTLAEGAKGVSDGAAGVKDAVDNNVKPAVSEIKDAAGDVSTESASQTGKEAGLKEAGQVDGGSAEIYGDVYDTVLGMLPEDLENREEIATAAANKAEEKVNNKLYSLAGEANGKIEAAAEEAANTAAAEVARDANGKLGGIKEKAAQLSADLGGVSDSLNTVSQGASGVHDGIVEIGDIVADISNLNAGLQQLSSGAGQLKEAADAVQKRSAQLQAGAEAVYQGIGADNKNPQTIWGGVTDLKAGFSQLTGENGENNADLNNGAAALAAGLSNDSQTQPGLKQAIAAYTAGVSEVDAGVQKLHEGSKTLNGSMQTILDGSKKLDEGAKALSTGAGTLKNGTAQLAKNNEMLTGGAKKLADGAKELSGGMTELKNGTQQLADNSGTLNDGVSTLSEGAKKLADGMSEISSGALELKDGCVKLNEEGVQKLANLYKTDVKSIDNRISLLKDAAKSYKTFSGTSNPENSRVKFIYKADSIEPNE